MGNHFRQSATWFSFAVLAATGACTKTDSRPTAQHAPPRHEHRAPHGGTVVVLGSEAYHLEFVLDAAAGRLTAYALDGEMENFIRVKATAFELTATVGAEKQLLIFHAVANTATGETIGDTSQFEARAQWLTRTPKFVAVLSHLEIRDLHFTDVTFNFPQGNEPD